MGAILTANFSIRYGFDIQIASGHDSVVDEPAFTPVVHCVSFSVPLLIKTNQQGIFSKKLMSKLFTSFEFDPLS